MNNELNYKSNPLNGVSLKKLVTEIVEHYGYEILYAYLNLNCFKSNPSIPSSVNFLKKTGWAREKVEGFYLYQYKNLPSPSYKHQQVPPRDRIIPEDQIPSEPAELTLESAELLREQSAKKSLEFSKDLKSKSSNRKKASPSTKNNPWTKYRNK
ncbi:VF530 family DNA-binding protein [Kangiella sp. TOML190]|uniref:VF530 family protein n=1 Tax=Kangiella sp. TOML190 TaxID=2931351 RepID=UPI00203E9D7A|nr:VF530 family protein [Kangiella sp. TOML190]